MTLLLFGSSGLHEWTTVSTFHSQGNVGPKVSKVQGHRDLRRSLGLLRTALPTRCPVQRPRLPTAGNGSFLDPVDPQEPCEAPSSLGGARVVPCRRNKPKAGSLLWAQMPSRALAQRQVHKDHIAAPWHTGWHALALSTPDGTSLLAGEASSGTACPAVGKPLDCQAEALRPSTGGRSPPGRRPFKAPVDTKALRGLRRPREPGPRPKPVPVPHGSLHMASGPARLWDI